MMFWLGFLFGDENHKLKELEQSTNNWTSTGSKSVGLYASQEVAQSVVDSKQKDGFKATMVVHSPLDLPL